MLGWQIEQQVVVQSVVGIGQVIGGIFGFFVFDENFKEDINLFFDGKVLVVVEDMFVLEWFYKKGVVDEGCYIGIMVQDFQKVIGKGDGKIIFGIDVIGIIMGVVKDFSKKVDCIVYVVGFEGVWKFVVLDCKIEWKVV